MKKKWRFPRLKVCIILLTYLATFFYTITFPSSVSWFIFYVFTLFLLLSYLSTHFILKMEDYSWQQVSSQSVNFTLELKSKWGIPLLIPELTLALSKDEIYGLTTEPALFTRKLTSHFTNFPLPRGHHKSLTLECNGYGLLGVFRHQSKQEIDVDMKIYPYLLPSDDRKLLFRKLTPILSHSDFAPVHEFHVREIRTYQDRDSMSNIDWKSSLKRNQWMVKEYDHEETSPIGIYFYGMSSDYFEELLSLAYSLFEDLSRIEQTRLFLIGTFDKDIRTEQTKEQFLYIQPSDETEKLNQLWQQASEATKKKIVLVPSDHIIPDSVESAKEVIYFTEKDLFSFLSSTRKE